MPWQDHYTADAFRAEVKRAAAVIGKGVTKNMIVRQCQTIQGKSRSTVTFPDSVWPSTTKSREERTADVPQVPLHIGSVRDGQCRAPLWPDFIRSTEKATPAEHMLCGHPVKADSLYCADHHELFYPAELQKRVIKPKKQEIKDNARYFG